jgi:hypothetical protein
MVIDGDGYVGIGTNSPSQLLTLDASNGYPFIHFNQSGTNKSAIGYNAGLGGLLIQASDLIGINAGGTERMRIDSSGNVGIGNTAPTNKLDITQGSARSGTHRTGAAIYATSNSSPTSVGAIECRHANGSQGIGIAYAGIYASGSNANQDISLVPRGTGQLHVTSNMMMTGYIGRNSFSKGFLCGGQQNIGQTAAKTNPIYTIGSNYVPTDTTLSNMYGIGFCQNSSFLPANQGAWGMYVTQSGAVGSFLSGSTGGKSFMMGNVGIGINTPSYKLHVSGTAHITGNLTCNASITTGNGQKLILYRGGVQDPYMKAEGKGIGFWTVGSRKVTITEGGSLGIGTTNPSQKLHVHGYYHQTNAGGDGTQFWTAIGNSGKGGLAFQWSGNGSNGHDRNLYVRMHNNSGSMINVGLIENSSVGTWKMNDFTGQHRCIPKNNLDADKYGLIVYSTGKYVNIDNALRPTMNDSLPICDLCSTENDIRVFGVISDDRDDNETRTIGYGIFKTIQQKANTNEKRIFINSVGEGGMWVCNKNGNISNGNYITPSSVPGYGVKQDSNQLLNSTVAKITCDCNFNLTPIVKQKLKVGETTTTLQKQVYTSRTETTTEITYNESLQKYVETTITETIDEEAYDTFQLYDTAGNPLVDESGNNKQYTVKRMENYTETKTELVYDSNGNVQYEDDIDANGQQQMEYEYDTRFLNADGSIIATEAEYNTKKANGENVYISCFVGCTYHCG